MTAIRSCPRIVTMKLRHYERFDKLFILKPFRTLFNLGEVLVVVVQSCSYGI